MLFRNIALAAAVSALLVLSACGGGGGSSKGSGNDDIENNTGNKTDTNGLEGAAIPEDILKDSSFLERYPPGNNHWDRDTIQNLSDNCPLVDNPGQNPANTELVHLQKYGTACTLDTNGDGSADAVDFDGDGVADEKDNCRWVYNPLQTNTDGDNAGDACDPDIDGDGVDNQKDNCPFVPNPDQARSATEELKAYGQACVMDTSGDGFDDAIDTDGDRVPDTYLNDIGSEAFPYPKDNCPSLANNPDGSKLPLEQIKQADADKDGIGDACDLDPKLPERNSPVDQKESRLSGQKVCRFGLNPNDQCQTLDEYEAERRAEQNDELRQRGVGSVCPFGDADQYKNARVLTGGGEFYSVEWHVPFGEIAPSLNNRYGAVDGQARTHATFTLPMQLVKNILEAGKTVWNIAAWLVSKVSLGYIDLSIGSDSPSVQINKKDGSRFGDEFSSATVFLSSPAQLANIGLGGGNVTLIDVDRDGNVVAVSDSASSSPFTIDLLTLVGGQSVYAIHIPAKRAFNGVTITPNANLISQEIRIHGICIE